MMLSSQGVILCLCLLVQYSSCHDVVDMDLEGKLYVNFKQNITFSLTRHPDAVKVRQCVPVRNTNKNVTISSIKFGTKDEIRVTLENYHSTDVLACSEEGNSIDSASTSCVDTTLYPENLLLDSESPPEPKCDYTSITFKVNSGSIITKAHVLFYYQDVFTKKFYDDRSNNRHLQTLDKKNIVQQKPNGLMKVQLNLPIARPSVTVIAILFGVCNERQRCWYNPKVKELRRKNFMIADLINDGEDITDIDNENGIKFISGSCTRNKYELYYHSDRFFYTFNFLAIFGMILVVVCLIFQHEFVLLQYIKYSVPMMNNFIACGCLLGYIAMMLFTVLPEEAVEHGVSELGFICQARVTMMCFSFDFCFGAILAKLFPAFVAARLCRYDLASPQQIKAFHQLIPIGVLVFLDIITNAVWLIQDPIHFETQVHNITEHSGEPKEEYRFQLVNQCVSEKMTNFVLAIIIPKAFVLVVALGLTGFLYKYKFAAVNVMKPNDVATLSPLPLLVYFLCIFGFGVTYFVDQYSPGEMIGVVHGVTCGVIFLGATTVMVLVFITKMFGLHMLVKRNPNMLQDLAEVRQERAREVERGRSRTKTIIVKNMKKVLANWSVYKAYAPSEDE